MPPKPERFDCGARYKGCMSILRILSCLVALAILAPSLARAEKPLGGAFFDSFDSFNKKRWYISDGWTNGDHQSCTWARRALKLEKSKLVMFFLPEAGPDKTNLCAEIQTRARYSYGTYEVRLNTPKNSGLNASFFTYIGPVHDMPHDEIDIEILTKDPSKVSLNRYLSGKPMGGGEFPLPKPTTEGFQTLAFRWEPGAITWYADGKEILKVTSGVPSAAQKIYLSFWSTQTLSEWMGRYKKPPGPLRYTIDWVGYTPFGETCQFPESMLCKEP